MKQAETCPGSCSLRCPVCARRFWAWAQMHTNGRPPKSAVAVNFYEAAVKFKEPRI